MAKGVITIALLFLCVYHAFGKDTQAVKDEHKDLNIANDLENVDASKFQTEATDESNFQEEDDTSSEEEEEPQLQTDDTLSEEDEGTETDEQSEGLTDTDDAAAKEDDNTEVATNEDGAEGQSCRYRTVRWLHYYNQAIYSRPYYYRRCRVRRTPFWCRRYVYRPYRTRVRRLYCSGYGSSRRCYYRYVWVSRPRYVYLRTRCYRYSCSYYRAAFRYVISYRLRSRWITRRLCV